MVLARSLAPLPPAIHTFFTIFFMVLYLQIEKFARCALEGVQCREEGPAFLAAYRERNGRQSPAPLRGSPLRSSVVALLLLPVSIPFTSLVKKYLSHRPQGVVFPKKGRKRPPPLGIPKNDGRQKQKIRYGRRRPRLLGPHRFEKILLRELCSIAGASFF